jgi:hypothetical protein
MASGLYTAGVLALSDGTYTWDGSTIKVMLIHTGYVYNPDHAVVDDGGTTTACILHHELDATNYAGGYGGAGRKTATITLEEQTGSNRVVVKIANLTWSSLGGATNDTPIAAVLIVEETDDTDSIPIAYLEFSGSATTGADYPLNFDATNGNIRLTV